jgi:hypothetical protein
MVTFLASCYNHYPKKKPLTQNLSRANGKL